MTSSPREVLRERGEVVVVDRTRVQLLRAEADHDVRLVDVGVVRALPDGHRHPSPIRVGAVDRGLHERRVDDRLGDSLRLRVVTSAVDAHREQLRRALAVTRDLAGQREGDGVRARPRARSRSTGPAAPLAMIAAVSLVDVSVSTLTALRVRSITRRNIASRSPAVDGGIGEEQRDQGRHVRLDHADALRDADDRWPRRPAADATFANVSVVMIPRAAGSASVDRERRVEPGEMGPHLVHRVRAAR